ncbi:MAG: 3,4-dihydroxy-2-butanone-4-phosphate synthase, partial [Bartonella sp.]|nr:3,4-dihydroxy-2-butanone-4-phosphate synthase [Bartonella sp.]
VFVYLRGGFVGVDCQSAIHNQEITKRDLENHMQAIEREKEWRQIGLGAQILRHLGISSVIVYASKERHYVGLEGFGIRISRTDIL